MLEHVDDVAGVAVQDGVDEEDVRLRRHVLDGEFDVCAGPSGRRQPAELDREQQLEQQPEEEHRRRIGEHCEQSQSNVWRPIPIAGGHASERDADGKRDDQRPEGQLEGRRALCDEYRADRLVVGQRVAEVAVQHADEVVPVLAQDRAIQSRAVPAACDLFGGEPPAERGLDRVPDDPHHEEHQGDQDPHHGDDEQQPSNQISAQGSGRALRGGDHDRAAPVSWTTSRTTERASGLPPARSVTVPVAQLLLNSHIRNRNAGSRVSWTPLMFDRTAATCCPSSSGRYGISPVASLFWMLASAVVRAAARGGGLGGEVLGQRRPCHTAGWWPSDRSSARGRSCPRPGTGSGSCRRPGSRGTSRADRSGRCP